MNSINLQSLTGQGVSPNIGLSNTSNSTSGIEIFFLFYINWKFYIFILAKILIGCVIFTELNSASLQSIAAFAGLANNSGTY